MCRSGRRHKRWRSTQLAPPEPESDSVGEDAAPALVHRQLLRILSELTEVELQPDGAGCGGGGEG